MSRKRQELARVVRRVVDAYERAKGGKMPSETTQAAAELDEYQAVIEVEAAALAVEAARPKGACCAKCAAKADAELQGMDVVFVRRK
jgi:hypothetical protein